MHDPPWVRTLAGLDLRYVLTLTLLNEGPATVRELVRRLDQAGLCVAGRASKTVSDALRWEVRKGRVRRVGRAMYAPGRMPRSTEWWIRRQVAAIHARQSVAPCRPEPAGSASMTRLST